MAPAWQSARAEINQGIGSSRTVAGPRLLTRKLLLSAQLSLTLVLLAGAALFVRTLHNLQNLDLGFVPEQLLQVTVQPKNAGLSDAQVLAYFDRLVDGVSKLPEVRSASLAAMRVMANNSWGSGITVEGVRISDSDRGPSRNAVGPNYFTTMRVPMILGRGFNERDSETAPKVAIINEAFARFYFGNQNPIGRRIDQGGDPKIAPRFTIVGVAKDGKYRGPRDGSTRFWYVPLAQSSMRNYITLYARTVGDPVRAMAAVRQRIAAVDPNVATMNQRTVESQIADGNRFERMIAILASFFGGLAVVLAAIGLYGVLSYLVNQRQREIGIRLALGASRLSVVRLVVSNIAGWAAFGIVLSLPAIYYGSNAVKNVLYDVRPMDPTAMLWAAGTLAAVSSLVAWLPARRAAAVSPATALRNE